MTKPPPLLLGTAVLFWGWQSGHLPAALVMAGVLESAQAVKTRWEFSDRDFTRIWTFCSVLLLAATVYTFTASDAPSFVIEMLQNPSLFNQRRATNTSSQAVATLIRWQPMIFFPFIAAQTFSSRDGVPLETISLILQARWRKAKKAGRTLPSSASVSVAYPYLGLCLFCASIHPSETNEFFWGLCALVGWALWTRRSPRYGTALWAGAFLLAVVLGFYGQLGIRQVQNYITAFNPRWFQQFGQRGFDPTRTRTGIGQVGRLKASDKIVIRLETKEGGRVPPVLREATYRAYSMQAWQAGTGQNDFANVVETNGTTYVLAPGNEVTTPVTIATYLPGGDGCLPLPDGTARLEKLQAFVLSRNSLGTVRAIGPGLVIFDAFHGPGISFDSPPTDADSLDGIPERELPALRQVIDELQLRGLSLPQASRALHAWFQTNFTYRIWQDLPSPRQRAETPLGRFLLRTRAGHCEYFATATVLLLRELGFPARYAVGYAVREPSGHNKYVVRQRDAHAWCLVWRDGLWREFDTTPASWFDHENEHASPFRSLSDAWSRLWFEFSRVRYGQTQLRQYFLWSLVPILGLLLWQILFSKRRRQARRDRSNRALARSWPGHDSEFYRLEISLANRGFPRESGEALSTWLFRSAADPSLQPIRTELTSLLLLHYRYRFDPLGLEPAERDRLRQDVDECLTRLTRN